jgi:sphingolipid 4-desaturase/C4-monooxygenase
MRNGFVLTSEPNSHLERGRQILRAHPEVKQYLKPYPPSALYILGVVGMQLAMAWLVGDASWWVVVLAAYVVGAFASHALFVLIHDAGHNLIVKRSKANRIWGIVCNVGQGVPTAMSFRVFHHLHHSRLDEYDWDADLAFDWEARLVGGSAWKKAIWLFLFPIIEMIRPMRVERSFVDGWIFLNIAVIVAVDFLVWWFCGFAGVAYLVLSTYFGVGFHLVGARWIQEHYTFVPGQETYSYYGPLNWIAFNIGYHNEHHDLVRVPWVHLPKVKALAPEFYDGLHAHRSWARVLQRFFFDPSMTLYSRITRQRSIRRETSPAPVAGAA